jgi:hypothetical protein
MYFMKLFNSTLMCLINKLKKRKTQLKNIKKYLALFELFLYLRAIFNILIIFSFRLKYVVFTPGHNFTIFL